MRPTSAVMDSTYCMAAQGAERGAGHSCESKPMRPHRDWVGQANKRLSPDPRSAARAWPHPPALRNETTSPASCSFWSARMSSLATASARSESGEDNINQGRAGSRRARQKKPRVQMHKRLAGRRPLCRPLPGPCPPQRCCRMASVAGAASLYRRDSSSSRNLQHMEGRALRKRPNCCGTALRSPRLRVSPTWPRHRPLTAAGCQSRCGCRSAPHQTRQRCSPAGAAGWCCPPPGSGAATRRWWLRCGPARGGCSTVRQAAEGPREGGGACLCLALAAGLKTQDAALPPLAVPQRRASRWAAGSQRR